MRELGSQFTEDQSSKTTLWVEQGATWVSNKVVTENGLRGTGWMQGSGGSTREQSADELIGCC